MKTAVILAFMTTLCFGQQAKPKPDEGTTLMEASLSIAKRVCSAHPDASVWIYHSKAWDSYSCSSLRPVLVLDADNAFDALIPLIQEVHETANGGTK